MYAIIRSGSKQYRVKKGDKICVELLGKSDGEDVEFEEVLFVGDAEAAHVGAPHVPEFKVKGKLLGTVKGEKVRTLKYKRRCNQIIRWGHRQKYSEVEITDIAS